VRFLGVPVWFDISALVLALLGGYITIADVSGLPIGWVVVLGIAGSSLLVCSILWHERSHIFAAKRYGIGCNGILISAFGGIAFLDGPARNPREAFIIAIAGPIASAIAAIMLFALAGVASELLLFPTDVIVWKTLVNFAVVNGVLATFNLIPIFPLDGGKITYSAIWAMVGNEFRARQLSILLGRALLVALFLLVLFPLTFSGKIPPVALIWYLLIALLVWKMQNTAFDRPI
jgi:Zn-dependent protease